MNSKVKMSIFNRRVYTLVIFVLFILLFAMWGIACGISGNLSGALLAICVLFEMLTASVRERLIRTQREYIDTLEKRMKIKDIKLTVANRIW